MKSDVDLNHTLCGMVLIEAGPFLMGSEIGPHEKPMHQVILGAYWIDKVLVTNMQFGQFVEATKYITDAEKNGAAWGFDGVEFRLMNGLSWRSYSSGREGHPVVMVSWNDANSYAAWADKRLPTEAEWEKAALGGCDHRLYPWGESEPDGTQCNFSRRPDVIPQTTAVKEFPANDFGLYDMAGNVWQWCHDWFDPDSYSKLPSYNPAVAVGSHRARRGGAWNVIQPFRLRCANRGAFDPFGCAPNIGFRCAR